MVEGSLLKSLREVLKSFFTLHSLLLRRKGGNIAVGSSCSVTGWFCTLCWVWVHGFVPKLVCPPKAVSSLRTQPLFPEVSKPLFYWINLSEPVSGFPLNPSISPHDLFSFHWFSVSLRLSCVLPPTSLLVRSCYLPLEIHLFITCRAWRSGSVCSGNSGE